MLVVASISNSMIFTKVIKRIKKEKKNIILSMPEQFLFVRKKQSKNCDVVAVIRIGFYCICRFILFYSIFYSQQQTTDHSIFIVSH